MLENLQQYVKSHQVLTVLASFVLLWAIYNYSGNKSMFPEYMSSSSGSNVGSNSNRKNKGSRNGPGGGVPMAVDDSSIYNQLDSVSASASSSIGLPPNCSGQANINPADLLPKDNNSSWNMKPMGSGDFLGVNLLNAGYLIGVDTVGSSLRNANMQIRSEPPNPQLRVSPWMNTTIEPDPFRAPLEIGCGPKPCSS
jgi:hypothetical protein